MGVFSEWDIEISYHVGNKLRRKKRRKKGNKKNNHIKTYTITYKHVLTLNNCNWSHSNGSISNFSILTGHNNIIN
jgi:PIN domain nuclease of toxin-antitoxin system